MYCHHRLFCALAASLVSAGAANDLTWLVTYDAKSLPAAPTWRAEGEPIAELTPAGLHLADRSQASPACFTTDLALPLDHDLVIEAVLKVGQTTGAVKGRDTALSTWPWRDGAAITLHVSDGHHQEALAFYRDRITTYSDRFVSLDAAQRFHTYRVLVRGSDMSVDIDGTNRIRGQNAFWKPAPHATPFVRFGSNSRQATGEAIWQSLRIGIRPCSEPREPSPITLAIEEPWEITRPDKLRQTRPYAFDVGRGLLLMSVAQGSDYMHEPYGLLKSTDEGRTWSIVAGLDRSERVPCQLIRRSDGFIIGVSRWTWVQPDGSLTGYRIRLTADGELADITPSVSRLPPPFRFTDPKQHVLGYDRDIFRDPDGALLAGTYSKSPMPMADGRIGIPRYAHLMRSVDDGRTWQHLSTLCRGAEPAIARLSPSEMTAVVRTSGLQPFVQVFSHDNGRTWSEPITLEEGSVCPSLLVMRDGTLVCSYGRPVGSLMFSLDGGRTWSSHHVVTEETGFNYSSIIEVRPGRLLHITDAPSLRARYIDVRRSRR